MDTQKQVYGLPQGTSTHKHRLFFCYALFVVALAIGASAWTSFSIAKAYGYHPMLGGFKIADTQCYLPWAWFTWSNSIKDTHGVIEQAVTFGQGVFIVPQLVIILFYYILGRNPKGNKNIHGSARWATYEEIQTMGLLLKQGVYVGGFMHEHKQLYLRHNGPEHILAFMPTRSGKGVSLILPTLLAWMDSSLVFDIKGENWALTSGYLQSQGHVVMKFDPADADGTSVRYNPVEEIRMETNLAISDAQNLVQMILDPDGKGFEGHDSHWKKNAAALLAAALLYCILDVWKKEQRMANLCDLAYAFADETVLFDGMVKHKHAAAYIALCQVQWPDADKEKIAEQAALIAMFIVAAGKNISSKPDNERGSVISTTTTDLALYKDPIVAANTSRSDFRLRDLMHHDKPVHLYLVVSPGEVGRLRPLLRILITQLIHGITAKMEFADGTSKANYKHRLLFMMDELTALGKLDILEKAIAYIAGYGGKFYLIVQDVLQLQAVYTKENALMANCHVRIGAAGNIPEAGKLLSELVGKTTVVETKTSLSGSRAGYMKSASVSVQEVARPLLTPDECNRLPAAQKDANGKIISPGDMLIFVSGFSPIYGKQILYFRDPIFAKRSKMPAPAESDRLREKVVPVQTSAVLAAKSQEKLHAKDNFFSAHLPAVSGK